MTNPLDILLPTPSPASAGETWHWATVTSVSPLRVRLDGDTTPLLAVPENLAGGLVVGARVWVQRYGRRVIVHGGVSNPQLVLPEPWTVTGGGANAITATAWDTFPNWTATVELVLPAPAWVDFTFEGWMTSQAGTSTAADGRVGITLSGATVSAPQLPYWGSTAWQQVPGGTGGPTAAGTRAAHKLIRCNAGTTVVTPQAYKTNAGVSVSFNYPVLTINPQRWAA